MSQEYARPAGATPLIGARELHGEVLDPSTGNVWQSLEPITREEYQALPLETGWLRVGVGIGAMDEHWFARSPGAEENGALQLCEIGGRGFGLCARPACAPTQPAGPGGPRLLLVQKHHVIRFVAAREVPVLLHPNGERVVHVIEGGQGKAPLELPQAWKLESVKLAEDWVLELPTPTSVFFFPNGDSYQGPLERLPGSCAFPTPARRFP
jgi:hypothetical protein